MKKRVISLLLVAVMLLSATFSVCANQESLIDKLISKLDSIPSGERNSYVALLIPLFMVDSGIDNLIGFVNSYSEEKDDDSFVNVYIGKLLKYAEKEVLINLLKTIKCTDLESRREFLTVLRYKTPLDISENCEDSVNFLLSLLYIEYPAVENILKEDGYTANVIANLISCAVKINGGNSFYLFDTEKNEFSAGKIDEKFKTDVENVWKNYVITSEGLVKADSENSENVYPVNLDFILEKTAEKLNKAINENERKKIADGLSETGAVFVGTSDKINGGSKPSGDINVKIDEESEKTVEYETDMKRPTLYKVEGENLVPVKYSIVENGKLKAIVESSGEYVIKETADKFADCDGWAKEYIEILASRGIINGKADTLFMPNDKITREEFVKLVVELLDMEIANEKSVFEDVKEDAWYAGYVNTAYKNSIINGISENEFGVSKNIKRQDMAKIINTVLLSLDIKSEPAEQNVFVDYENIADYAKEHVLSIYNLGIISGDENKNFNPDNFATRAEAAKMIYGMLVQIVNK